jgi:hypothetical protein
MKKMYFALSLISAILVPVLFVGCGDPPTVDVVVVKTIIDPSDQIVPPDGYRYIPMRLSEKKESKLIYKINWLTENSATSSYDVGIFTNKQWLEYTGPSMSPPSKGYSFLADYKNSLISLEIGIPSLSDRGNDDLLILGFRCKSSSPAPKPNCRLTASADLLVSQSVPTK